MSPTTPNLPHTSSPENDLDDQLEQLFDSPPSTPLTTTTYTPVPEHIQPNFVPASPDRETSRVPNSRRPRSILDALAAQRESKRLTAHAALLADEAATLIKTQAPTFTATEQSAAVKHGNQCETTTVRAATTSQQQQQGTTQSTPSDPIAFTPVTNRKSFDALQARTHRKAADHKSAQDAKSTAETPQQRAAATRKARNAFRVVGKTTENDPAGGKHTIENRNISNMSLRHAPVSAARLAALFEHSARVDIAQIAGKFEDIRAGRLGEWVLFGCVVKKHAKKETKNGAKFAVWSVCNMPRWPLANPQGEGGGGTPPPAATMVTMLVFDEAFAALHALVEGSAIAVRRAMALPPRESEQGARSERGGAEWSGYCLRVSKCDQVMVLGMCSDFRLCGELEGTDGGICGKWYDASRMTMCVRHTQRKRMRMTRGTRMDVNNAERPLGRGESARDAVMDANDISRVVGVGGSVAGGVLLSEEMLRAKAAEKRKAKALLEGKSRAMGMLRDGMKVRGGLQVGVGQGKVEREEKRRRVESRGEMLRRMVVRERKEKGIVKGVQEEKEKRQQRYEKMVNLLMEMGFTLSANGDLMAPKEEELDGLVLRKADGATRAIDRSCSKDSGSLRRTRAAGIDEDDVCLSDESS